MNEYRYALKFKGHRYEYEVQAIAKLFIPGERFMLYREDELPFGENLIETCMFSASGGYQLYVYVQLDEKKLERRAFCQDGDDPELPLCRLLYMTLHEVTGYTSPWGMLTGIRPVRKVIQALDSGMTPEEAADSLQKQFLVSEEKRQLALSTALVQKPILPHDPKEIGLYVSIPFCPTRCSYCSFVSHSMETAAKLIPAYTEKLCKEIQVYGEIIRKFGLKVHSVYIGGGTPTAIPAEQLACIMQSISEHIDLSCAREYTVEAGRPDTITAEKLAVIQKMGATRISVNPQTLQDAVLEAIGRRHTAQQAVEAFRLARQMGFDDINMDLIAGLPTDTYEGFSDTLRQVMELDPDSITVHTLTVKRAADLYQKDHSENTAVSEVEKMVAHSEKVIPEAGWQPYYLYRQKNTLGNLENVGYAKPGKENLYNILIMDETQTILAAGCAASTKVVNNGDITRIMNYKFPYEYIDRFDLMMEKKQELVEKLSELY